ncbi:MAG: TetR/AcrR family transcriptional regulator [Acidimicrobiales bacterium]
MAAVGSPPRSGPSARASAPTALQAPTAALRSRASVNVAEMIARVVGVTRAAPRPCTARALHLAGAEGVPAVTIRRLAQELAVTPMALYWHVSSKEELLAAMGDQLFAGLPPATDPALPWQEQLREIAGALVSNLRGHPNVAALAAPRVLRNEEGRLLTEKTLDLLRSGGFSVEQAAEVARHTLRTAISLVVEQAAAGPGDAPSQRDEAVRLKRLSLLELPPGRFPRLIEAAGALAACADEEAYYSFGLDLLIGGIGSNAPLPRPAPRRRAARAGAR